MRRDAQVVSIHEHLDNALAATESYLAELKAELAANEARGGDSRLSHLLRSQIALAERLRASLTGDVWDLLLDIVNRSVPLNQARDGEIV